MKLRMWVGCVLGFFGFSNWGWSHPSIEVVQSFPVETDLNVEGIRSTAQAWVELIRSASTSIDVEQFYISSRPGESLEPVLDELRQAAARGVRVRVIVDSVFFSKMPTEPLSLATVPNIQVKVLDYSVYGGVQHAKFFVVDRARAYVGSANFDWLALSHIHEVGVVLRDAGHCTTLSTLFDHDWNQAQRELGELRPEASLTQSLLSFGSQSLVSVYASPYQDLPSGISPTLDRLLKLIDTAQDSLQVQMYQYSTRFWNGGTARWTRIDEALRRAAQRGVKVRLLLDRASFKKDAIELHDLARVPHVEVKRIEIPQWSGGPLDFARLSHSKYMIVDESVAWVGSENWSENYFQSSRNVGLLLQDSLAVRELTRIFSRIWTSPYAR